MVRRVRNDNIECYVHGDFLEGRGIFFQSREESYPLDFPPNLVSPRIFRPKIRGEGTISVSF